MDYRNSYRCKIKQISILILLCLGQLICATTILADAQLEWTILIYMAADNNLSQAAFDDINEMESVPYNDSLKVIVQVDPNQNLDYPPYFTTARRYEIRHDNNPDSIGSRLIADLGEINSAAPDEISDFANWGFNRYPSKKRMLILWDHGDGWYKDEPITKSICYDNQAGEKLSVANGELREAISNINYHLDILAFDACLMQMAEVIGEIYEFCDFVVGSEETIPADGFPYGDVSYHRDGILDYLVTNPSCSPKAFASEIVDRYINSYQPGGSQASADGISLSAIETKYFTEFQDSLSSFTLEYSDTLYNNIYEDAHSSCQPFNGSVDLYQFFSLLGDNLEFQEIAEEIVSAIDSMIVNSIAVYNGTTQKFGKLSVYFPLYPGAFFDNWWGREYYQLAFVKNTRWDRFLNFYYNSDIYSPIITDFSMYSQGNTIHFSWEAYDPSLIKYQLEYKPAYEDTDFSALPDTGYIDTTSYEVQLPFDEYAFRLRAIDEFDNDTLSTLHYFTHSEDIIFKFYPNPYVVSKGEDAKFKFTTQNAEGAEIFMHNAAGELVMRLKAEPGTYEIPLPAGEMNLASGVYFCVLKTGKTTKLLKIALVK
jgi:hypothetical protein